MNVSRLIKVTAALLLGSTAVSAFSDEAGVKKLWCSSGENCGIVTRDELMRKLSPIQFSVTQEEDTEQAFTSDLNSNKAAGIYVDIVSGEPLFSSADKYDSGTGWPSFSRPISPDAVVEKPDGLLGLTRTEIRSKIGDSHLGHVFSDGPQPTGLRYCMNGAALKFVPKDKMAELGYQAFLVQVP